MQPVARTYPAFAQVFAPKHFLADQRHTDCVAEIVIRRIAIGDELERHVADIIDDAGIVRLEIGIGADVAPAELLDEGLDNHGGRIEHALLALFALPYCAHTLSVRRPPRTRPTEA